jgi:hypothetical protein
MAHTLRPGPTVVIAEPHQEMAGALEDVVTMAGCVPVRVSRCESVRILSPEPAAIVVRVATEMPLGSPHLGLEHLGSGRRPLIVALASNDADVAEAERLHCEVIAREPHQVQMLYDTLLELASR